MPLPRAWDRRAAPVLVLGLFWGPLAERVRCRAPYHADDREPAASADEAAEHEPGA